MAQWQRKLDISDVMEAARDGDMTIAALSRVIASRLSKLADLDGEEILNQERGELVRQFRDFADDESDDTGEFDALLYDLYEWADTPLDNKFNGRKVCWVESA